MLYEIAGNLHMHTRYSDGEGSHADLAKAAIQAGLDFIVVTDHNIWVDEIEGYFEHDGKKVLVLVGEEAHDMRRDPQVNHCLIYGAEQEMATFAPNPQTLLDETAKANGYSFFAHPYEKTLNIIDEPDYGWYDWDLTGFTGLEIWNYMSSFKSEVARATNDSNGGLFAKLKVLRMVDAPEKHITAPEPEVLAKWDELLAEGRRVACVGNSDAHATVMNLGPIKRVVFPYEFCFRAVNTHLLINEPLSGDVAHDKALILGAVGKGNGFVGYDMAHPTKGFRFSGKGRNAGIMGDDIRMDIGATLQVVTPTKCHIRLIRHGEIVREEENSTTLIHTPVDEGAYRIECYIPFHGKQRGWIYSNPIYLK